MRRHQSSRSASNRSRGRRTNGNYSRRLGYEALEDRRLLAVTATLLADVLTVKFDAADQTAFINRLGTGDIRVSTDAAGAVPVAGSPFAGVNEIVVDDTGNVLANNQTVTFQNDIPLTGGLDIEQYVETVNVDGEISGTTSTNAVFIDAPVVNLNNDIRTNGGSVEMHRDIVNVVSTATIATDLAGGSLDAGNVRLFDLEGPGGLTIDARADGGGAGGIVHFHDVGTSTGLAHFHVFTDADIEWHNDAFSDDRIRTDGDVTLSGGFLTDTESNASIVTQGGHVQLDLVSINADLHLLRVNSMGAAASAGSVNVPLGFDRIGVTGDLIVYREPTTGTRITVNASAFEQALADYGDAPNTYSTTLASDGARHLVGSSLYLGTTGGDNEPDGPAAGTGVQDDNSNADDEDGVTFPTSLVPSQPATVQVTLSDAGFLDAWIDYSGGGIFADPAERPFGAESLSLTAGTHSLNFTVPGAAAVGPTYARFRVSTAGSLTPTGLAADGEVEDYAVSIVSTDFSDAAPSYGIASHTISNNKTLGPTVDGELAAATSATANGDDTSGPIPDDETGVTFPTPLIAGQTGSIQVNASAVSVLNAWIDYNGSGAFDVATETIGPVALAAGDNAVPVAVPATAVANTFGRFRVSTAGGLSPTGGPAADGEVEDHPVTIQPPLGPTVLFMEDFQDGAADPKLLPAESGSFTVVGTTYRGERLSAGQNAITTIKPLTLPASGHFKIEATVNMTGGNSTTLWSNGLIIFDYVDANNFKYAGAFEIIDRYIIGQVSGGTINHIVQTASPIAAGQNVNLSVEINGSQAVLSANGSQVVSHTFGAALNTRPVGFGTLNANTIFDNIKVTDLTT